MEKRLVLLQKISTDLEVQADGWKQMLCSKSYEKSSRQLFEAMADLAKKLAQEPVDPDLLAEFDACRLIPLDKENDKVGAIGVRPIGIGEVLRRIVGKVVVGILKNFATKSNKLH